LKNNNLFIADTNNAAIREVNYNSGILSTVAGKLGTPSTSGTNTNGDGGPPNGPNARLNTPQGIAVSSNGQVYYISDTGDQKYVGCRTRF
jgi:hypothetical protein